jgi:hypothetical protein
VPFQHLTTSIKDALESGAYADAFEDARQLSRQELPEALETVLAAVDADEAHYDAFAVRLVLMGIEEKKTSLYLLHWLAGRLLEQRQLDYRDYASILREWAAEDDAPPNKTSLWALDKALRDHDLEQACRRARQFSSLPLDRVLRLVLLMADRFDGRYESAARRFVVRTTLELQPPILQVKKLADCFAHVHDSRYGPFAKDSLRDVVGQLRRRERLSVRFVRADEP